MALNVSAGLAPTGGGSWETHDAQYGKGGWRAVADIAARDAIATLRRSAGMAVYVIATGATYLLGAGLGNGDWALASSGAITAGNGLTGTTALSVLADGSSIEVSASGIRRAALSGAVSAPAGSNVTTFASGDFGSLALTTTGASFTFGATAVAPSIYQADDATAAAVGDTLAIHAQNVTGAGATGGALTLTAGTSLGASGTRIGGAATLASGICATFAGQVFLKLGVTEILAASAVGDSPNGETRLATAGGSMRLSIGATQRMLLTASNCFFTVGTIGWVDSQATPIITQQAKAGAAVTGETMLMQAQGTNGATATGGLLSLAGGDDTGGGNGGGVAIRPGSGGTANGAGNLNTAAGVSRFKWDSTGLAFFAGATAAKQTVTGSRGGNAALQSLLTALATYGLITDSSS